jgi:cold shock CspA family protein
MAIYKKGNQLEDRIIAALEANGCLLERKNQILDHEHKIDFVVIRFPENPRYFSLGVQLTSRLNDSEKLREFNDINSRHQVTDKVVYLEISESVNLERGGVAAVLSALMGFQFDAIYKKLKIGVITIEDDLSYGIRSVSEVVNVNRQHVVPIAVNGPVVQPVVERPVQQLPPAIHLAPTPSQPPAPSMPLAPRAAIDALRDTWANPQIPELGTSLRGIFATFKRTSGYGFIKTEDNNLYYAHISSVVSDDLRQELQDVPYNSAPDTLYIPVVFKTKGVTRTDSKYPEAAQIQRAKRN